MNIDVRARRATADLHAAVAASVTVGSPNEFRQVRRNPMMVGAAVIAVLAIILGATWLVDDRREPSRVVSTRDDLPLLMPRFVPAGLVLEFAQPSGFEGTSPLALDAWYFGDDAGAHYYVQRSEGGGNLAPSREASVDLDGVAGAYAEIVGPRTSRALIWFADGFTLSISSFDVDRERLIAAALVVRRARADIDGVALPDGSRVVERDPGGAWLFSAGPIGRTARWSRDDGRYVSVNVRRVSGDFAIGRQFWSGVPISVLGHEGWRLPPMPGNDERSVTWLESSGIAVSVAGNIDEEVLVQIAQSLAPVTAAEWDRNSTPAVATPTSVSSPSYDVLLAGRWSDSGTWQIAAPKPPSSASLCLLVDFSPATSPTQAICSARAAGATYFADRLGARPGHGPEELAVGYVAAEVARVVVETSDAVVEATLGPVRDGRRVFVAPVVLTIQRVRTFDRDGRELGDLPIVDGVKR